MMKSMACTRTARRALSTSNIIGTPWKTLGFDFTQTKSILKYNHKDGEWDDGVLTTDFTLNIHPLSNALHYGQALFEGLKAFHGSDGKVRVFNANKNAERLQNGAERLGMATVSKQMFNEALDKVIIDNVDYVPPYGSGGAMYIRPFLFGHGAKMGLGPAPEVRAHATRWHHLFFSSATCLSLSPFLCLCLSLARAVRLLRGGVARRRVLQGRPPGHRRHRRRGV